MGRFLAGSRTRAIAFAAALLVAWAVVPGSPVSAGHFLHARPCCEPVHWQQFAYTPLQQVPVYNCTDPAANQAPYIQAAVTTWNNTGRVNFGYQNSCPVPVPSEGVRYVTAGATYGFTDPEQSQVMPNVLAPETVALPYRKLVRVRIDIPFSKGAGNTVFAHELGHAAGLGDHYVHDAYDNPANCSANSYTEGGVAVPTIMDCPGYLDPQPHDVSDLDQYLYRNAPFSSYPFTAAPANFYTVGFHWGDRSHNEDKVQLFERPYGGGYGFVAQFPRNWTSWLRTNLSPGYGYCYYNRNINAWDLIGANSGESCTVTPHAVQNVNGYFGGGYNYTLCWDQPAAGSGVASYRVLLRWFNGTNTVTYSFDTVNPNTACFGRVGFSSAVFYTGWYHISVAGCTSDGLCSNYWDMTDPSTDAVRFPCYGDNSYCAYSSAGPNIWYHAH